MPDKPFVINDRRKFTAEGDIRPDAPPSEPKPEREEQKPEAVESSRAASGPQLVSSEPATPEARAEAGEPPHPETGRAETADADATDAEGAPEPPPLTTEQIEQVQRAYDATVDRLDTAIRAQNIGGDHLPAMNFERFIQSLYMQALLQLGGAAEPGQPPQVDLLGARQTIDMLSILAEKTKGNLSADEDKLVQSALFELRMAFLEITQALARQAATRGPGAPPTPGGPSIVR